MKIGSAGQIEALLGKMHALTTYLACPLAQDCFGISAKLFRSRCDTLGKLYIETVPAFFKEIDNVGPGLCCICLALVEERYPGDRSPVALAI
ncbi:hypothetical protein D3C75_701010 [compost metagenome]